jgi:hypothetical protein
MDSPDFGEGQIQFSIYISAAKEQFRIFANAFVD